MVGVPELSVNMVNSFDIGYSFRLAVMAVIYALCHRQDNISHDLYYNSRGALAGTRNSSMGPP